MPKDALPPVRATVEAKPLVTRPRPYKTKYCELYPMLEALPADDMLVLHRGAGAAWEEDEDVSKKRDSLKGSISNKFRDSPKRFTVRKRGEDEILIWRIDV